MAGAGGNSDAALLCAHLSALTVKVARVCSRTHLRLGCRCHGGQAGILAASMQMHSCTTKPEPGRRQAAQFHAPGPQQLLMPSSQLFSSHQMKLCGMQQRCCNEAACTAGCWQASIWGARERLLDAHVSSCAVVQNCPEVICQRWHGSPWSDTNCETRPPAAPLQLVVMSRHSIHTLPAFPAICFTAGLTSLTLFPACSASGAGTPKQSRRRQSAARWAALDGLHLFCASPAPDWHMHDNLPGGGRRWG